MKYEELIEFEKTLSREDLDKFNELYVDITVAIQTQRAYDNMFIYSVFNDMNIRTAIYLGYLIAKVENGNQ